MSYLLQVEEDALINSFGEGYKPDFADIPEHLKTERVAYDWFQFRAGFDFEQEVSDFWVQIPHHLLTDRLRDYAISLNPRTIKDIHPSDTGDYLRLFLSAHSNTFLVTKYLHPEFRTASTVDAMMQSPSEFERSYLSDPWVAEVMTEDQLEAASRLSVRIMASLPVEKISTEAMNTHLVDSFYAHALLRLDGKLRVSADYLRLGRWPESTNPLEGEEREPLNALDALELIEKSKGKNVQAVYIAWLMNQPIEQVIGLMTTRTQIKLALEMYTEDELRPLMKNNRLLKGALLEESLGL